MVRYERLFGSADDTTVTVSMKMGSDRIRFRDQYMVRHYEVGLHS